VTILTVFRLLHCDFSIFYLLFQSHRCWGTGWLASPHSGISLLYDESIVVYSFKNLNLQMILANKTLSKMILPSGHEIFNLQATIIVSPLNIIYFLFYWKIAVLMRLLGGNPDDRNSVFLRLLLFWFCVIIRHMLTSPNE